MKNVITLAELEKAEQTIFQASMAVRRMIGIVEPQIEPGEIHPATMWKTENASDLDLVLVNMDISSTDNENWVAFIIPLDLLNIVDEKLLKQKWAEWWKSEQVKNYKVFNRSFLGFLNKKEKKNG